MVLHVYEGAPVTGVHIHDSNLNVTMGSLRSLIKVQ